MFVFLFLFSLTNLSSWLDDGDREDDLRDGQLQEAPALDGHRPRARSSVSSFFLLSFFLPSHSCCSLFQLKKRKLKVVGATGAEGADTDDWMVVDCGNFVVHFMKADTRRVLDLERAWREKDFPCHRDDLNDDNWVHAYPFPDEYSQLVDGPALTEEEERRATRGASFQEEEK